MMQTRCNDPMQGGRFLDSNTVLSFIDIMVPQRCCCCEVLQFETIQVALTKPNLNHLNPLIHANQRARCCGRSPACVQLMRDAQHHRSHHQRHACCEVPQHDAIIWLCSNAPPSTFPIHSHTLLNVPDVAEDRWYACSSCAMTNIIPHITCGTHAVKSLNMIQ